MFVVYGLKEDPENEGWVLGWGVFRPAPWHLVGVYATKDIADNKATILGDRYSVQYGSHRLGSNDFISVTRFE